MGSPAETLFESIAAELGIETEMGKAALIEALHNIQLFDRKQHDYGPHNISLWGELGLAVRCTDKVMRLRNLLDVARSPKNESLLDSWADLANYGIIGQLVNKGIWPTIK